MSPIEMSNETKTKGKERENQKQFAHLFRTPTLRAAAHKKGVMKKRFTLLQRQRAQAKEDFLKALANDSSHFDGK